MPVRIIASSSRPDLCAAMTVSFAEGWPEFVFHDVIADAYLDRVRELSGHLDILLTDDDQVLAGGWGVPVRWDGATSTLPDGYDGSLMRAVEDHERGVTPDTLVVAAAQLRPGEPRRGLATELLAALKDVAAGHGLTRVVAPVRPTLKHRYPLIPMREYLGWTRPDGLPFDPWLRTHHRMGATILGVAERSMVVTGTVADWETWTGLAFPASGAHIVEGALNPVTIDVDADRGTYEEPNVWMRHT